MANDDRSSDVRLRQSAHATLIRFEEEVDGEAARIEFQRRVTLNETRAIEATQRDRAPGTRRVLAIVGATTLVVGGVAVLAWPDNGSQLATTSPEPVDTTTGSTPSTSQSAASSTSPTTAIPTTSAQPSLAPRELVELTGRTWVITEVDGQPRPFAAHFEMSSGRITGHDGCNRYDAASQVTAIADGETSIQLGERTSTAVQCLAFGENEEWWSAPNGRYRVDDDTLTITGTDGHTFEAVDLETLEMVNSPEQIVGVWKVPGGASIEFAAEGTIRLPCAAIGTWTFDVSLRTEIDESADTSGCGDFGPASLGWTYEALVSTSPVIRILPDDSLLVGSSAFGRLAPSSSDDVATIDSELGRVSYVLPTGSWPDPQDVGQVDDVTVGHAWWIVPDCCYLKLTLQDFVPPRPTDEHVGQFESNGLAWDMYDIGPRDHSTLVATATVDGLTISVGAQGRSGVSTDPSPSQIAESVARSVSVD